MMPIGLFMQPHYCAGIADFAWQNGQRIVTLTGQRFTETYRTQVLQAADGVFDSTPLTRALTALAEQHAPLSHGSCTPPSSPATSMGWIPATLKRSRGSPWRSQAKPTSA